MEQDEKSALKRWLDYNASYKGNRDNKWFELVLEAIREGSIETININGKIYEVHVDLLEAP